MTGTAPDWESFLRSSVPSPDVIDGFSAAPGWSRFDPELGYVPQNAVLGGMGGSLAIETFDESGARLRSQFRGRPARIACYGDAFTEGMNVGNGETWEEYLAAHLGEPVGNFGVGGYGVYQSYRRMIRQERDTAGLALVILTITEDAPIRSLMPYRRALVPELWGDGSDYFHGNFWPYLELDLDTGRFVERENRLASLDDLTLLCNADWVVDALGDHLASRLIAFARGLIRDPDLSAAADLADSLGVPFDPLARDLRAEVHRLITRYGEAAAIHVLDRARDFTDAQGARLLVTLAFTTPIDAPGFPRSREDREILDHLVDERFAHVDLNARDRVDVDRFGAAYRAQHFILNRAEPLSHLSPQGHHRFAFAIKDAVVDLLDRKPVTYESADLRSRPYGSAVRSLADEDPGAIDRHLATVLAVLRERYAEPWDVHALARLAGMSRSALHRHFVGALGVPPMEYVKQLRLDEAARLLADSDDTVGQVATKVGFSDPFHFSRAFSRRFGAAPSRFRRNRVAGTAGPRNGTD